MSSSKERLRLAHELLDRELENSNVSSKSYTPDDSTKPWSFEVKKEPSSKDQINQIQKKLLDLQKKMDNIVSDEDQYDDADAFIRKLSKDKQQKTYKQRKVQFEQEEDSADDDQIYRKIQNIKNHKAGNAKNQKDSNPLKYSANSVGRQADNKNPVAKMRIKQSLGSLKDSVKSIKSVKSRKSNFSQNSRNSRDSQTSLHSKSQKIHRSSSKNSVKSVYSNKSNKYSLHQVQKDNVGNLHKISNLEKQLSHYKRLCKKQKEKLDQYRIMEIQLKKLQITFNKSEQIRKQQKKIIENMKAKH